VSYAGRIHNLTNITQYKSHYEDYQGKGKEGEKAKHILLTFGFHKKRRGKNFHSYIFPTVAIRNEEERGGRGGEDLCSLYTSRGYTGKREGRGVVALLNSPIPIKKKKGGGRRAGCDTDYYYCYQDPREKERKERGIDFVPIPMATIQLNRDSFKAVHNRGGKEGKSWVPDHYFYYCLRREKRG